MNEPAAPSAPPTPPPWLAGRLRAAGGRVAFRTYMDWVLHDPQHGAYGSGRLRIGPRGDFATSPSLGADFAQLLVPQIADWLAAAQGADTPVALVETGPGEGHLALQLAEALAAGWPRLAARTELVLVEPNAGLEVRQRRHLRACPLPVRWSSFGALAQAPVRGVVLAHEVLDALAVERIEWDGALWRRQCVALRDGALRLEAGEPLEPPVLAQLEPLGLLDPSPLRPAGWCTELHPGLEPWLRGCAAAVGAGRLLVIDYALEARRYYAAARSDGTLLAYRAQRASADPLLEPGRWDLTAHLCLESLREAALASGWRWLGQRLQGEALLALGLAARLQDLQRGSPAELGSLLARRETLLRLVDPAGLGAFRWIALARGDVPEEGPPPGPLPRFLRDPPRPGADGAGP
ncbi:MAG: SAM-dependent methyltransferase [Synechococcaceae cyanobacterium]|nr:SAM-dependent methyltransferase [Synechococcaceae cyanobacterium]